MRRTASTSSVLGVAPVIAVATEAGVALPRLLAGTGLTAAMLADPAARVRRRQEHALVGNLLALVPDPAVGLRVGRAYDLSAFGLLGAAVRTAPTIADAVRLFLDYIDLTYTPFEVGYRERDRHGELAFTGGADLGLLRRYYLDRDLSFVASTARTLLPETWRRILERVDFDYPAPAEARRYQAQFPCPVRFGQPVAGFRFDRRADPPRPGTSPLALRVLEEHLAALRAPARDDAAERVRHRVTVALASSGELPSLEDVAADLGATSRTVRRHLDDAGTSYRAIVDEVRRALARRWLADRRLRVEDVALRLGYGEAASFIRAFRRWTGRTPRAR